MMTAIKFKEESYRVIGACMEVHRELGRGLLEIVYKDALEYEFKLRNIPFEREKAFQVQYKNITLSHQFFADFVVYDNIILEIKSRSRIVDEFIKQTLNYMAIANSSLGLVVNFGEPSLQYKRLIL